MVALSNPTSVLLVLHSNHLISGHRYLVVSLATRTGHEAIQPCHDAMFNGLDESNEAARPGGKIWPLCWLSEADHDRLGPLSVRLLSLLAAWIHQRSSLPLSGSGECVPSALLSQFDPWQFTTCLCSWAYSTRTTLHCHRYFTTEVAMHRSA